MIDLDLHSCWPSNRMAFKPAKTFHDNLFPVSFTFFFVTLERALLTNDCHGLCSSPTLSLFSFVASWFQRWLAIGFLVVISFASGGGWSCSCGLNQLTESIGQPRACLSLFGVGPRKWNCHTSVVSHGAGIHMGNASFGCRLGRKIWTRHIQPRRGSSTNEPLFWMELAWLGSIRTRYDWRLKKQTEEQAKKAIWFQWIEPWFRFGTDSRTRKTDAPSIDSMSVPSAHNRVCVCVREELRARAHTLTSPLTIGLEVFVFTVHPAGRAADWPPATLSFQRYRSLVHAVMWIGFAGPAS